MTSWLFSQTCFIVNSSLVRQEQRYGSLIYLFIYFYFFLSYNIGLPYAVSFRLVQLLPRCAKMLTTNILNLSSTTSSYIQDYSPEWNPEEMAGNMILLGNNKIRQPVQVKVYRTSVEHFAVVYPMKKACRPLGVLNLKNTMVERLPTPKQFGFTVRQCGFDTPLCSLTFFSESARDLDRWIDAFTCRNSSTAHTSSLPIVKEDDEV